MSFSYIMSYFALLLVISHRDILIVWLLHPYWKHTTIIWFILCSRTYTLQCYVWIFLQCGFPLKSILQSWCKQGLSCLGQAVRTLRRTVLSLQGMTGILLISLLSSLSLIHQAHHHFSCRGSIARHLVFQAYKSVLEATAVSLFKHTNPLDRHLLPR